MAREARSDCDRHLQIVRHTPSILERDYGLRHPFEQQHRGRAFAPAPHGYHHSSVRTIGVNCTILHQVTVGGRAELAGLPTIGNEVLLGAGSKILGPIRVGDGAKIGANAVVVHDMPERSTAVGVPAKIVRCDASGSM